MKKQPLLTGFPSTIFATSRRHNQAAFQKESLLLSQGSPCGLSRIFEDVLPPEWVASIDPTIRKRTFGCIPVLWAWLHQVIDKNSSCSKAVSFIQSWQRSSGLAVPVGNNSSYCQARKRLGNEFLTSVSSKINSSVSCLESEKWKGLSLKAIDGTSVQLLDTAPNQEAFPQPSMQKPGCGFPVMGISALVNLSTGMWESSAISQQTTHDAVSAYQLIDAIGEGDLLLADRAYCSYALIAVAKERAAEVVFRLHQARHRCLDWRKGKRCGRSSRIVRWKKPKYPKNSPLSRSEWDQLPDHLELRLIKKQFIDRYKRKSELVVVTTLTDSKRYPEAEVADLYAKRWEIEVRIRDFKTTLNMEVFRVKSPDMALKTLNVVMIAYNLIRLLMRRAGGTSPPEELSFAQVCEVVLTSTPMLLNLKRRTRGCRNMVEWINEEISSRALRCRPGRQEPRATKKRPKPFAYLTKPRHEYVEIPHREHHRKSA